MASKLYLLVCEGPTDILVIENIAKKISEDIDNKITIRELAPQRDATTNRYPSHGWKEVKRWCQLYGVSLDTSSNTLEAFAARSKNWRAEIGISNADGLIIQMDTDIVEYITDFIPGYEGSTKSARKRFAQKAILSWLGETSLPSEIYLLLSTASTETWLLATHDRIESVFNDLPQNFDFEDIEDVVRRLIDLGYVTYIDRNTGQEKLNKDLNIYSNYATQIANNLSKIRFECEETEKLCQKLES